MKKTYNKENKINILNELNPDDTYKKLLENKHKMEYIQYFTLYRKNINCQKLVPNCKKHKTKNQATVCYTAT